MPGAIIIKTEIILFFFFPYTWSMSKTWSFRCKIYDKLLLLLMQLQAVLNFFFRERRKTQVTSIGIFRAKTGFYFYYLGIIADTNNKLWKQKHRILQALTSIFFIFMFHFVFAFMTKRESKLLFFLKSRTKILNKKKTHEVKFTGIHSSCLRCCSLEWPPLKWEAGRVCRYFYRLLMSHEYSNT